MQGFRARTIRATLVATIGVLTLGAGAAQAAPGLNGYRVKATAENLRALAAQGFDVTEGRNLDKRHDRRRRHRRADRPGQDRGQTADRQRGRDRRARRPDGRRDGRRLQRLDEVRRRRRRRQGAVHRAVRARPHPISGHRQEARRRDDVQRARDRRAAGHQERHRLEHRRPSRRALQRDAARARVAGGRDLPPHAELLLDQLRQDDERGPAGDGARQLDRAVVRLRQQPRRLRIHVHARKPPVAQEPRRQQQRQRDRGGRRRRPQPQLLVELGP